MAAAAPSRVKRRVADPKRPRRTLAWIWWRQILCEWPRASDTTLASGRPLARNDAAVPYPSRVGRLLSKRRVWYPGGNRGRAVGLMVNFGRRGGGGMVHTYRSR